jgi:hypothetical protein
MSVRCSGRDTVVLSGRSWVRLSKVASFFGFLGFLKNINGDGHVKTPALVNGINGGGHLKTPVSVNRLTETGKTTTSVNPH